MNIAVAQKLPAVRALACNLAADVRADKYSNLAATRGLIGV
jgi:hypothetical protein